MLTKRTVTDLAKQTGYTKAYISMVLSGKRKAPPRLKVLLTKKLTSDDNIIQEFLTSRETSGCAPTTLRYYRQQLSYYRSKKGKIRASQQDIEKYLNSVPPNDDGLGNRHAACRALRAFYNWVEMTYDLPNPMKKVKAPIQSKPILPALTREQVMTLIDSYPLERDKAIIALLTESGLRLTELTNIKPEDIDWKWNVIEVMGKGRKEAYAPFGILTLKYLQEWINLSQPEKGTYGE